MRDGITFRLELEVFFRTIEPCDKSQQADAAIEGATESQRAIASSGAAVVSPGTVTTSPLLR
jgi:hypothetical protein